MDIMQSFWSGSKLGIVGRLCCASYIANGHELHLYTYGPIEDAPIGVIIKDANEIVPQSDLARFKLAAQFSDWFKYHLLFNRGNWWVDMDTVCLRPFDFLDETIFVEERLDKNRPDYINADFCKAPKGSPVMAWCIAQVKEKSNPAGNWHELKDYCELGPWLQTAAVRHFGICPQSYYKFFNPAHVTPSNPEWLWFNGVVQLPPDIYGVHFWRCNRQEADWKGADNSIFEQLRRRYAVYR